MIDYKFGTVIEIVDDNKLAYEIMYNAAMKSWGVFVEPTSEIAKNSQKVRAYVRKKQPKPKQPQA